MPVVEKVKVGRISFLKEDKTASCEFFGMFEKKHPWAVHPWAKKDPEAPQWGDIRGIDIRDLESVRIKLEAEEAKKNLDFALARDQELLLLTDKNFQLPEFTKFHADNQKQYKNILEGKSVDGATALFTAVKLEDEMGKLFKEYEDIIDKGDGKTAAEQQKLEALKAYFLTFRSIFVDKNTFTPIETKLNTNQKFDAGNKKALIDSLKAVELENLIKKYNELVIKTADEEKYRLKLLGEKLYNLLKGKKWNDDKNATHDGDEILKNLGIAARDGSFELNSSKYLSIISITQKAIIAGKDIFPKENYLIDLSNVNITDINEQNKKLHAIVYDQILEKQTTELEELTGANFGSIWMPGGAVPKKYLDECNEKKAAIDKVLNDFKTQMDILATAFDKYALNSITVKSANIDPNIELGKNSLGADYSITDLFKDYNNDPENQNDQVQAAVDDEDRNDDAKKDFAKVAQWLIKQRKEKALQAIEAIKADEISPDFKDYQHNAKLGVEKITSLSKGFATYDLNIRRDMRDAREFKDENNKTLTEINSTLSALHIEEKLTQSVNKFKTKFQGNLNDGEHQKRKESLRKFDPKSMAKLKDATQIKNVANEINHSLNNNLRTSRNQLKNDLRQSHKNELEKIHQSPKERYYQMDPAMQELRDKYLSKFLTGGAKGFHIALATENLNDYLKDNKDDLVKTLEKDIYKIIYSKDFAAGAEADLKYIQDALKHHKDHKFGLDVNKGFWAEWKRLSTKGDQAADAKSKIDTLIKQSFYTNYSFDKHTLAFMLYNSDSIKENMVDEIEKIMFGGVKVESSTKEKIRKSIKEALHNHCFGDVADGESFLDTIRSFISAIIPPKKYIEKNLEYKFDEEDGIFVEWKNAKKQKDIESLDKAVNKIIEVNKESLNRMLTWGVTQRAVANAPGKIERRENEQAVFRPVRDEVPPEKLRENIPDGLAKEEVFKDGKTKLFRKDAACITVTETDQFKHFKCEDIKTPEDALKIASNCIDTTGSKFAELEVFGIYSKDKKVQNSAAIMCAYFTVYEKEIKLRGVSLPELQKIDAFNKAVTYFKNHPKLPKASANVAEKLQNIDTSTMTTEENDTLEQSKKSVRGLVP